MNNIHYDIECNDDETDSDTGYTYDQPVDGIETIYFSIKTKDGINPFEGVLIDLNEYLKNRCPNQFPNNKPSFKWFRNYQKKANILTENQKKIVKTFFLR